MENVEIRSDYETNGLKFAMQFEIYQQTNLKHLSRIK